MFYNLHPFVYVYHKKLKYLIIFVFFNMSRFS